MGIGTDHAPAPDGGMSPYGRWEIDVRMFDAQINQIDAFTCRQDLWVDGKQFVVRLTRQDNSFQYEARAEIDGSVITAGQSGFGGQLRGALMRNNGVYLNGQGGSADYILVATPTASDHFRCFREFHVKQPISLWGTPVPPGTYYVTTEDQLISEAKEPPPELRTALSAKEPARVA